nr:hypothetical protein Iba_chr15aCG15080 [Ipomoea batatas]
MAPPVAPPSKPASKKVRNDRREENQTQKSYQNGDKEKDRILMSDQEDPLASKSEEAKEIEEGNCVSNPEPVEDGNLETNPEESKSSPRPHESSSDYTEMIKIRLGNLDMPVSPRVLDELIEKSKSGEGDMETLLSKYVMEEIQKAIKRKAAAMVDCCKLEEEFAKEIDNKIEEISKNQNGVMKSAEERDFFVPQENQKHLKKKEMIKLVTSLKQDNRM